MNKVINDLIEFDEHVNNTIEEIFESNDSDQPLHIDMKIELNGKVITLPFHADLYEHFNTFLKKYTESEIEYHQLTK